MQNAMRARSAARRLLQSILIYEATQVTFIFLVVIGTSLTCGLLYWIGNLISPDVILPPDIDDTADDDFQDMSVMNCFDIINIYNSNNE